MARVVPIIVLLVLTCTASANISTKEQFVFYDVKGNSARELRASINRERFALGKRFDALTTWVIRWYFTYEPGRMKCHITSVTIDTDIIYLMPQWPDAGSHPDKQLVQRWNLYHQQLTAHERQHGELVKLTAQEIERAIYAADDTPLTCSKLEYHANNTADNLMRALDKASSYSTNRPVTVAIPARPFPKAD